MSEPAAVPIPTRAQSAEIYRELLGACPVCKSSLSGHATAWLCSLIVDRASRERRLYLEQLIEARRWSEVQAFQEWQWDADVLEYRVLRCPTTGLALLTLVFTYQMEDQDWLDATLPVSREHAPELERLLEGKWLAL